MTSQISVTQVICKTRNHSSRMCSTRFCGGGEGMLSIWVSWGIPPLGYPPPGFPTPSGYSTPKIPYPPIPYILEGTRDTPPLKGQGTRKVPGTRDTLPP